MQAEALAILTIVGSNFAVDGNPVPYGDLVAGSSGTLTGTLASGDSLNNEFLHGVNFEIHVNSIIRLVPEPSTALLLASGVAGLAVRGRRRR